MRIEAPSLAVEFKTPEVHVGDPVMIRVHVTKAWAEGVRDQEVAALSDGMELHEKTNSTGFATFMFRAPEVAGDELDVRLRLVPAPGIEFASEPAEADVAIPVLHD